MDLANGKGKLVFILFRMLCVTSFIRKFRQIHPDAVCRAAGCKRITSFHFLCLRLMCPWNSPQRTSFVMIHVRRYPLKRNGKIAAEACENVSHFLLSSPGEAPARQSFAALRFIFNTAQFQKQTRKVANHTVPLTHVCCDTHELRVGGGRKNKKRYVRFCLNHVN